MKKNSDFDDDVKIEVKIEETSRDNFLSDENTLIKLKLKKKTSETNAEFTLAFSNHFISGMKHFKKKHRQDVIEGLISSIKKSFDKGLNEFLNHID